MLLLVVTVHLSQHGCCRFYPRLIHWREILFFVFFVFFLYERRQRRESWSSLSSLHKKIKFSRKLIKNYFFIILSIIKEPINRKTQVFEKKIAYHASYDLSKYDIFKILYLWISWTFLKYFFVFIIAKRWGFNLKIKNIQRIHENWIFLKELHFLQEKNA